MDSKCTIVVTGGSSGLGAATATQFAQLGARVGVIDLTVPASPEGSILYTQGDITSSESIESCLETLTEELGPVQVLVNCAGILAAARVVGRNGPHDLELFRRVIEVNLIGSFNTMRLVAQRMSVNEPNEQGERGVIINTASVSAFEGQIGQTAYSAAKGGIAGMTLPVARDLARHGIRVVSIAPGVFLTPMMEAAPPAVVESLVAQTEFPQRLGDPREYAQLVQQIVENPMFNGSTIRLDGAVRMQAK